MSKFDFRSFIKDATLEKLENQKAQILKESYQQNLLSKASRDYILDEDLLFEQVMLSTDILEEGMWSKVKNFGARVLGTMEKGGKIVGRSAKEKKAISQYEKILEKTAGGILKKFMNIVEKEYPGFPNMEDEAQFNSAVADIYTFYDSISHAALTPEDIEGKPISAVQGAIDNGKIDVLMANSIIEDLRRVMIKIMDYELADVYKHFDESQEKDGEKIEEFFGKRGWEKEAERQAKEDEESDESKEDSNDQSSEEPAQNADAEKEDDVLSGKEGGSSAAMKGLKSNTLPVALGLTGAAGVLGALLMKTAWFASLLPKITSPGAIKVINNVLSPSSGEGVTQMIGRIANGNPASLDSAKTWGDLVKAMKSVGIADPNNPTALGALAVDPAGFMADWTAAINAAGGPGPALDKMPLGQIFPGDGLGIKGKLGLKLGKSIVTPVIKAAAGTTATSAAALTATTAASTMLSALGIGLAAAAAGVKALRLKGQSSSRLEKLQKLRDAMKDLKAPEITDTDPKDDPKDPPTDNPPTPTNPLDGIEVGDFVIVKNKRGQDILTKVSSLPSDLQENQWEDSGNIFIVGGDWSIPLKGRRGYSSKGQKWIAVKDGVSQIRKAEAEDFTKAVETDSKVADKMGVPKMDHEAEFEDGQSQNVEYSKFQARLANDERIMDDDFRPSISPKEMTMIFKAVKDMAGDKGHFQRFILHGTDQGAGAKEGDDFLPDASVTSDPLDEAKAQAIELMDIVKLLTRKVIPRLEDDVVPVKSKVGAIIDALIKAKMMITHKGKDLKKSPKFRRKTKKTATKKGYNVMDVPKGEMGKGEAPPRPPSSIKEMLAKINAKLSQQNRNPITESQLIKILKDKKIL